MKSCEEYGREGGDDNGDGDDDDERDDGCAGDDKTAQKSKDCAGRQDLHARQDVEYRVGVMAMMMLVMVMMKGMMIMMMIVQTMIRPHKSKDGTGKQLQGVFACKAARGIHNKGRPLTMWINLKENMRLCVFICQKPDF